MVLRFFDREKGGIDYLLANPTAEIVDDNVALARGLINAMPLGHGQRFLAGVLSEDGPLPDSVAALARREFEEQLRAGLPTYSLHTLWVRHHDKNREEQHFNTPQYELIHGKILSPYIDRIDRNRFAAWVESFNLRHGLMDSWDRLRSKPDYSHSRHAKEDQKFLIEVWEFVHDGVQSGRVSNRNEVIAFLRSGRYDVRAETHAGKPLQQPVITTPAGKNLRLKSSIYYRCDFGEELHKKLTRRKKQPKEERLKELQKIIDEGMEFRAFHLIRRLFGRREQRLIQRGKAREKLHALMQAADKKMRAIKPLIAAFSVRRALDALKMRSIIAAVEKDFPRDKTEKAITPKEYASRLLEHTTKVISSMQTKAVAALSKKQPVLPVISTNSTPPAIQIHVQADPKPSPASSVKRPAAKMAEPEQDMA